MCGCAPTCHSRQRQSKLRVRLDLPHTQTRPTQCLHLSRICLICHVFAYPEPACEDRIWVEKESCLRVSGIDADTTQRQAPDHRSLSELARHAPKEPTYIFMPKLTGGGKKRMYVQGYVGRWDMSRVHSAVRYRAGMVWYGRTIPYHIIHPYLTVFNIYMEYPKAL